MRLLICAGGTGGGVYPALSVLQAMKNEADPVLWVGSIGGMEGELVKRMNIPFETIPAAGVHGVGLSTLPRNLSLLGKGVLASRRILAQFRPDVLFFTGGYLAVPMAVAGIPFPSLLYVPDIEPGLALKVLARFADRIALTEDVSRQFFPRNQKMVVTGYPIREDLKKWTRETGRKALGLSLERPVVLVLGGSKGARSINYAIMELLPRLLSMAQVVHVSGPGDYTELERVCQGLPENLRSSYNLYPYLHEEMGAALAAADLAVSRSGASTLGEFPLAGLPVILVPYPYAWRYQKVNAGYLEARGAAVVLNDEQLSVRLEPTLRNLLNNPRQLQTMRQAMQRLAQPDASQRIAAEITSLASARKKERG